MLCCGVVGWCDVFRNIRVSIRYKVVAWKEEVRKVWGREKI